MSKIAELRQKRDSYLSTANRIISTAVAEQRGLSEKEQTDVDGLKVKAESITETIKQHDSIRDLSEGSQGPYRSYEPSGSAIVRMGGDDSLSVARMARALAAAKGDVDRAANHALKVFGDESVSKALAAGMGAAGGFTVPEQYSVDLIEFLRPASVVRRMRAAGYPLPQGNATVPRVTSGSTAQYIAENTDIAVSEPRFGAVRLIAKKLCALVPISNDLVRFSSPSADAFVRNDMVASIASAEDMHFIRSDGTGAAPKGLRYWAPAANRLNVNATVNVVNVDADLNRLILALLDANVRMISPGWLMAPRTMIFLMGLRDSNGLKVYPEMERGMLKGYPFATTTAIPKNLAVTNTNESEVYFADFADVVIGEVPSINIDVSTEAAYHDGSAVVSAFSRDQTVIRVIMQNDLVLRHSESVAVLVDVDWGA